MMGHPVAYWTFPRIERRRRLIAGAVGVVLGMAIAGVAFLAGAAS